MRQSARYIETSGLSDLSIKSKERTYRARESESNDPGECSPRETQLAVLDYKNRNRARSSSLVAGSCGTRPAPLRYRISHRTDSALHGEGPPGCLLQPLFSCTVLSSRNDQDTADLRDSGRKTAGHVQNLCAGR